METARPHVLPDAIDRACREGDAKTVLAWVDAGNDVNLLNDIRQSLLALTVFRDLPDLGAALLARGADPNRGDWPAILHAVHAGSLPWIDALLAHGANPDAGTADTHALYEALLLSGGACCAVATRLLEAGADPRRRTHRGLDFIQEMERLGRWAAPGNHAHRQAYDELRRLARHTAAARDLAEGLPGERGPSGVRPRF